MSIDEAHLSRTQNESLKRLSWITVRYLGPSNLKPSNAKAAKFVFLPLLFVSVSRASMPRRVIMNCQLNLC